MNLALLITLIVNLLATGIKIVSDFMLKKKDEKLLIMQIKGSKKLEFYESVYLMMKIIKNNFIVNLNAGDQTERVHKLQRHVSYKEIYLSTRARRVIADFCDYSIKISGSGDRDIDKEDRIFSDFEEEFMK